MRTGTVLRVGLGLALGAGVLAWFIAASRKGMPVAPATEPAAGQMSRVSNDNPPAGLDEESLMDEALAQSFPASDPPASAAPLTIGPPARTARPKQAEPVIETAEASA